MDFQKEKNLYLAELLEREVIKKDEFDDIVFKTEINAFHSCYLSARFMDNINFGWSAWQAAKSKAVPDLGELQERIAGHQYYHDEHGHMIVDMDDVVKEISGFDSYKAHAVPEGFVLVPKEPTKKMLASVHEAGFFHGNRAPTTVYKLMIEAAQEQSHD